MTGEIPEEKENQEQEVPIVVEETMIPVKNQDVTLREEIEEDGKYLLFNAENELILVINSTGKFILENCSDERTVGDIIKNIRENFTVKEDMDITSIVKEYFATLLLAKLVKIKEN